MINNDTVPEKDWLIMLYMAGDNNLDPEMVLSLQFLLEVEKLGNHAIVAEFDSNRPSLGTQRYDFTNRTGHRLEDYEDETIEDASTGNPETLKKFLEYAEGKFDAQRRMLILSGHGSGATEDLLLRDENADDFLSIDELKGALDESGYTGEDKLDIIGMDACYMSMAEVCYELSEHAEILIGAEGIEPEFGWPYSRFLRRIYEELKQVEIDEGAARPLEREEFAILCVREYVEHYKAYDTSVDLAAIRLNRLGELKQKFGSLVEALNTDPKEYDKLTSAHWRAQTYKSHQYVDLKDFCDQINHVNINGDATESAAAIVDHLENAVLLSGCSGFAYQWSHGLSLYFPWAYVSPDYLRPENVSTGFAKESGWESFIKEHVEETRREARYSTKSDPPMSGTARNILAAQYARVRGEWATRIPSLKPGDPDEIKRRLDVGGKNRALRWIERLEADGIAADEIAQELRSEISTVGRGSPKRSKGSPKRSKYMPLTHYPADRAIAIKNFAPVTGVAWWPHEPDERLTQVRSPQDDG